MSEEPDTLRTAVIDGALLMRLHRPRKRNAVNTALADQLAALDRAVGLGGADPQATIAELDPGKLGDPLEVDHVRVLGEAELEKEEQLGPADVDDRVLAVSGEQLGGLGDRARTVAVECRQRGHAVTASPLAESVSSTASAAAPRSTSIPWSARPRPSAETETSGYSEREPGPMWPILNTLSISSP